MNVINDLLIPPTNRPVWTWEGEIHDNKRNSPILNCRFKADGNNLRPLLPTHPSKKCSK